MKTHKSIIAKDSFSSSARGPIALRIDKLTYEDGNLIKREPHRAAINPGTDIDEYVGRINADLVRMGFPEISADDLGLLKQTANSRWTPEVKSAWIEDEEAEMLRNVGPIIPDENTREESAILALIKKGVITEAEIEAEKPKKVK